MCCYFNCCEQKRSAGHVSFFKLPSDHRRPIWIKHGNVLHIKQIAKTSFMCENHFYAKDILVCATYKGLSKSALPIPFSSSICCCSEESLDVSCVRALEANKTRILSTSTVTPAIRNSEPINVPPAPLPPVPSSPAVSIVNAANYTVRRFSLPPADFSTELIPEHFPSPGLGTYKFVPRVKSPETSQPLCKCYLTTPKKTAARGTEDFHPLPALSQDECTLGTKRERFVYQIFL